MTELFRLVDRLAEEHGLSLDEYRALVEGRSAELCRYAAERADALRRRVYSNHVYVRGLIEIGNVCRNDCLYCGIRRSNRECRRYVLSDEQILDCCAGGHALGLRSFVLQGGEGCLSTERACALTEDIKRRFPDCAVTLSLGELPREDYRRMFKAGADRYLLRHETADPEHYRRLHPAEMSFENRMRCLDDLRSAGFQTGCGFMVGSPYQTPESLALDLKFIERFSPEMCGIGPFIPQKDTPFRDMPAGDAEQTLYLLSLVRLICPNVLLPATTALSTVLPDGHVRGLRAGANVIMPNLSPDSCRSKYALYDNKLSSGSQSADNLRQLEESVLSAGYRLAFTRGDHIK